MAIFGPKPWVNPVGKMSIIRLFELLVFIGWSDKIVDKPTRLLKFADEEILIKPS